MKTPNFPRNSSACEMTGRVSAVFSSDDHPANPGAKHSTGPGPLLEEIRELADFDGETAGSALAAL
jgi:hypothetical protein